LIDKGRTFPVQMIRRVKGRTRECHSNSAIHYLCRQQFGRPGYNICAGYTLTDEALWIQHAWLFNAKTRTILETTRIDGLIYFGVVLQGKHLTEEIVFSLLEILPVWLDVQRQ
jgi:hypothetical protein